MSAHVFLPNCTQNTISKRTSMNSMNSLPFERIHCWRTKASLLADAPTENIPYKRIFIKLTRIVVAPNDIAAIIHVERDKGRVVFLLPVMSLRHPTRDYIIPCCTPPCYIPRPIVLVVNYQGSSPNSKRNSWPSHSVARVRTLERANISLVSVQELYIRANL